MKPTASDYSKCLIAKNIKEKQRRRQQHNIQNVSSFSNFSKSNKLLPINDIRHI